VDDAEESSPFLLGQEEKEAALRALGFHSGRVRQIGPWVGADSVNGGRRSG
jgi:hypothetical protein